MEASLEIELKALSRQKPMNDVIDRGDSIVQQFYTGVTVFVTGGSGFIGKQLIEKLFRSCAIKKMYLLMRPKKKTTVQERFHQILKDPVFNLVYAKNPHFSDKIEPIEGDVTKIRLGINDKQWRQLTEEVNMIFHIAATTKFNAPLRDATFTNVLGTREALALARECSKCKSFVYVSTAFSHATKDRVGEEFLEQFYPCPLSPETLIQLAENVDEERLNGITEGLINGWPNTYTFTKAVTEELIRTNAGGLPICIVRPPIVTPAYCEPAPGWLDVSAIFGPSGILMLEQYGFLKGLSTGTNLACLISDLANAVHHGSPIDIIYTDCNKTFDRFLLGVIMGVLHLFLADEALKLSITPVDYVNNITIMAPWDAAERRRNGDANIPFYNATNKNSYVTIGLIREVLVSWRHKLYSPKAVWHCGTMITKHDILYRILALFLHYIPAYLLDKILDILGKKPKNIKSFVKLYKKIDESFWVYKHFLFNAWDFKSDNITTMISRMSDTDQAIFNCDLTAFDREEFIRIWTVGIRKYIIKDGLIGSRSAAKWQYIYLSMNVVFLFGIIYLLWKLFSFMAI